LLVVNVEGDEVSVTVIVTKEEDAGTVNLYQTSALEPQLPVPVVVVLLELYSVPAVGLQSPETVKVVALAQRSLAGDCANDEMANRKKNTLSKRFFMKCGFCLWI
jgi:hypothetical protein